MKEKKASKTCLSATYAILCAVLILAGRTSINAENPPEYPSVSIPGWHAQAVKVALGEFQKHQGGKNDRGEPVYGDLRHYTVQISKSPADELPIKYEHEECVRVDFVPELSPKDYQENVLGGRTSFGINVSYDVCKRTLKIVKTSFSR